MKNLFNNSGNVRFFDDMFIIKGLSFLCFNDHNQQFMHKYSHHTLYKGFHIRWTLLMTTGIYQMYPLRNLTFIHAIKRKGCVFTML